MSVRSSHGSGGGHLPAPRSGASAARGCPRRSSVAVAPLRPPLHEGNVSERTGCFSTTATAQPTTPRPQSRTDAPLPSTMTTTTPSAAVPRRPAARLDLRLSSLTRCPATTADALVAMEERGVSLSRPQPPSPREPAEQAAAPQPPPLQLTCVPGEAVSHTESTGPPPQPLPPPVATSPVTSPAATLHSLPTVLHRSATLLGTSHCACQELGSSSITSSVGAAAAAAGAAAAAAVGATTTTSSNMLTASLTRPDGELDRWTPHSRDAGRRQEPRAMLVLENSISLFGTTSSGAGRTAPSPRTGGGGGGGSSSSSIHTATATVASSCHHAQSVQSPSAPPRHGCVVTLLPIDPCGSISTGSAGPRHGDGVLAPSTALESSLSAADAAVHTPQPLIRSSGDGSGGDGGGGGGGGVAAGRALARSRRSLPPLPTNTLASSMHVNGVHVLFGGGANCSVPMACAPRCAAPPSTLSTSMGPTVLRSHDPILGDGGAHTRAPPRGPQPRPQRPRYNCFVAGNSNNNSGSSGGNGVERDAVALKHMSPSSSRSHSRENSSSTTITSGSSSTSSSRSRRGGGGGGAACGAAASKQQPALHGSSRRQLRRGPRASPAPPQTRGGAAAAAAAAATLLLRVDSTSHPPPPPPALPPRPSVRAGGLVSGPTAVDVPATLKGRSPRPPAVCGESGGAPLASHAGLDGGVAATCAMAAGPHASGTTHTRAMSASDGAAGAVASSPAPAAPRPVCRRPSTAAGGLRRALPVEAVQAPIAATSAGFGPALRQLHPPTAAAPTISSCVLVPAVPGAVPPTAAAAPTHELQREPHQQQQGDARSHDSALPSTAPQHETPPPTRSWPTPPCGRARVKECQRLLTPQARPCPPRYPAASDPPATTAAAAAHHHPVEPPMQQQQQQARPCSSSNSSNSSISVPLLLDSPATATVSQSPAEDNRNGVPQHVAANATAAPPRVRSLPAATGSITAAAAAAAAAAATAALAVPQLVTDTRSSAPPPHPAPPPRSSSPSQTAPALCGPEQTDVDLRSSAPLPHPAPRHWPTAGDTAALLQASQETVVVAPHAAAEADTATSPSPAAPLSESTTPFTDVPLTPTQQLTPGEARQLAKRPSPPLRRPTPEPFLCAAVPSFNSGDEGELGSGGSASSSGGGGGGSFLYSGGAGRGQRHRHRHRSTDSPAGRELPRTADGRRVRGGGGGGGGGGGAALARRRATAPTAHQHEVAAAATAQEWTRRAAVLPPSYADGVVLPADAEDQDMARDVDGLHSSFSITSSDAVVLASTDTKQFSSRPMSATATYTLTCSHGSTAAPQPSSSAASSMTRVGAALRPAAGATPPFGPDASGAATAPTVPSSPVGHAAALGGGGGGALDGGGGDPASQRTPPPQGVSHLTRSMHAQRVRRSAGERRVCVTIAGADEQDQHDDADLDDLLMHAEEAAAAAAAVSPRASRGLFGSGGAASTPPSKLSLDRRQQRSSFSAVSSLRGTTTTAPSAAHSSTVGPPTATACYRKSALYSFLMRDGTGSSSLNPSSSSGATGDDAAAAAAAAAAATAAPATTTAVDGAAPKSPGSSAGLSAAVMAAMTPTLAFHLTQATPPQPPISASLKCDDVVNGSAAEHRTPPEGSSGSASTTLRPASLAQMMLPQSTASSTATPELRTWRAGTLLPTTHKTPNSAPADAAGVLCVAALKRGSLAERRWSSTIEQRPAAALSPVGTNSSTRTSRTTSSITTDTSSLVSPIKHGKTPTTAAPVTVQAPPPPPRPPMVLPVSRAAAPPPPPRPHVFASAISQVACTGGTRALAIPCTDGGGGGGGAAAAPVDGVVAERPLLPVMSATEIEGLRLETCLAAATRKALARRAGWQRRESHDDGGSSSGGAEEGASHGRRGELHTRRHGTTSQPSQPWTRQSFTFSSMQPFAHLSIPRRSLNAVVSGPPHGATSSLFSSRLREPRGAGRRLSPAGGGDSGDDALVGAAHRNSSAATCLSFPSVFPLMESDDDDDTDPCGVYHPYLQPPPPLMRGRPARVSGVSQDPSRRASQRRVTGDLLLSPHMASAVTRRLMAVGGGEGSSRGALQCAGRDGIVSHSSGGGSDLDTGAAPQQQQRQQQRQQQQRQRWAVTDSLSSAHPAGHGTATRLTSEHPVAMDGELLDALAAANTSVDGVVMRHDPTPPQNGAALATSDELLSGSADAASGPMPSPLLLPLPRPPQPALGGVSPAAPPPVYQRHCPTPLQVDLAVLSEPSRVLTASSTGAGATTGTATPTTAVVMVVVVPTPTSTCTSQPTTRHARNADTVVDATPAAVVEYERSPLLTHAAPRAPLSAPGVSSSYHPLTLQRLAWFKEHGAGGATTSTAPTTGAGGRGGSGSGGSGGSGGAGPATSLARSALTSQSLRSAWPGQRANSRSSSSSDNGSGSGSGRIDGDEEDNEGRSGAPTSSGNGSGEAPPAATPSRPQRRSEPARCFGFATHPLMPGVQTAPLARSPPLAPAASPTGPAPHGVAGRLRQRCAAVTTPNSSRSSSSVLSAAAGSLLAPSSSGRYDASAAASPLLPQLSAAAEPLTAGSPCSGAQDDAALGARDRRRGSISSVSGLGSTAPSTAGPGILIPSTLLRRHGNSILSIHALGTGSSGSGAAAADGGGGGAQLPATDTAGTANAAASPMQATAVAQRRSSRPSRTLFTAEDVAAERDGRAATPQQQQQQQWRYRVSFSEHTSREAAAGRGYHSCLAGGGGATPQPRYTSKAAISSSSSGGGGGGGGGGDATGRVTSASPTTERQRRTAALLPSSSSSSTSPTSAPLAAAPSASLSPAPSVLLLVSPTAMEVTGGGGRGGRGGGGVATFDGIDPDLNGCGVSLETLDVTRSSRHAAADSRRGGGGGSCGVDLWAGGIDNPHRNSTNTYDLVAPTSVAAAESISGGGGAAAAAAVTAAAWGGGGMRRIPSPAHVTGGLARRGGKEGAEELPHISPLDTRLQPVRVDDVADDALQSMAHSPPPHARTVSRGNLSLRGGPTRLTRTYDWAGSMMGSMVTLGSNSLLSSPAESDLI
ncbi:hypothetical protein NESM_000255000 [Novymonas esmeraldas]|uniref:Uncharacterized protein n=1 Tax=Novymonas esmeraldas TaxID=1808958 RepID=A0AAW0F8Z1_9TRYP